jgi:hypothetical protein
MTRRRASPPTDETWATYAARLPHERLAVARRLFDELERYVEGHHLPWTATLRPWWLGYKRDRRYYVTAIELFVEKPIQFVIKLPASAEELALDNPYPNLESWWDEEHRQWTWAVPSLGAVPDITPAVNLSREFQPETGPMAQILNAGARPVRTRL